MRLRPGRSKRGRLRRGANKKTAHLMLTRRLRRPCVCASGACVPVPSNGCIQTKPNSPFSDISNVRPLMHSSDTTTPSKQPLSDHTYTHPPQASACFDDVGSSHPRPLRPGAAIRPAAEDRGESRRSNGSAGCIITPPLPCDSLFILTYLWKHTQTVDARGRAGADGASAADDRAGHAGEGDGGIRAGEDWGHEGDRGRDAAGREARGGDARERGDWCVLSELRVVCGYDIGCLCRRFMHRNSIPPRFAFKTQ